MTSKASRWIAARSAAQRGCNPDAEKREGLQRRRGALLRPTLAVVCGYYMILIVPGVLLTFPASRAFVLAGYDDHWRRLVVIIFGLTFPGWIMAIHTLTYFGLAAAGLREWNINRQNLVLPEHLALTATATGVFSALFLAWLGRSWFLLATGLFSAAVLGGLTWLSEWSTVIGVAFWLVATVISLKAWSLERQRELARGAGAGSAA